jgi:hypothetical protein
MFVPRVAGDDWRATGARRSVSGCMDEFAIHRAAIDGFLKRAQSCDSRSAWVFGSQLSASEKTGSRYPSLVPNLREGARRLAELIIAQLREAERNVEPGEIQELEALTGSDSRTPERRFTGS